jgi:predicted site-specific integrase-resolvase
MGEEDRAGISLKTLRTSQVAEMLGVGPTTVLKYERLGKIPPAYSRVGKQRRRHTSPPNSVRRATEP